MISRTSLSSRIILLIICSALWMACEQQRSPCLQPKTVSLRVGCYRAADTGTAGIDSLLPNLIVGAIDMDTARFWIVGADNINKFPLLLSPKMDSCRWFIQPDSAVSPIDTITFLYSRSLTFLSNTCGYTFFYTLQNIRTTNYNIDSVRISGADVNADANTEHVQIFF